MFKNLLSWTTAATHKRETLAQYQVNFGQLSPKWRRLTDIKFEKNKEINDDVVNIVNVSFEEYSFIMFFNASQHGWNPGEPFSRLNLVESYVKTQEQGSFEPVEERFWFPQIDQILEFLPRVSEMYFGE